MELLSVLGLVLLLLTGLALACIAGVWWIIHCLRRPPRRTYASALAQGRPGEPDEIASSGGTRRAYEKWSVNWRGTELPVWDFTGDGPPDAPIFILTHGWGDSRIGAFTRAGALLNLASRFIAWDMPGHGDAPGTCDLGTREHEALRAIIERVALEEHAPHATTRPIVLLGWSLGAGVSIAAMSGWENAAARRVRAIIAEAPYRHALTPARNVMRILGVASEPLLRAAFVVMSLRLGVGLKWSRPRPFDRALLAASLACPILVLHGEQDVVSPAEDGRAIARSAQRGELLSLFGVGHHGMWTDPAAVGVVLEGVQRFLATHTSPTTIASCPPSTV